MAAIKENLSVVLRKKDGKCSLTVEKTPLPPAPGPDEVQLSTHFCGLCGTDIHISHTGEIGPFVLDDNRPLIIGHEASARVMAIGANVTNVKVGDNVTIEPAIPCGKSECKECREGNYNWCEVCNNQAKGLPHHDGLLSRLYNHPAAFVYKLPESLDLRIGALGEPMAVVVHAIKRAQITVGQNVLVTGAGTMGLLSFLVAKKFGAEKVIVSDINAARLKLAKQMGADYTYLATREVDPETAGKQIKEMFGEQIDLTLECTGTEPCTRTAVEATRMGGKVVAVGIGKPLIQMPLATCTLKEIDVLGVCRFRNTFPMAVKMLSSLDLMPIVTHEIKLENALEAFKTMERGEGLKVMVDCRPN